MLESAVSGNAGVATIISVGVGIGFFFLKKPLKALFANSHSQSAPEPEPISRRVSEYAEELGVGLEQIDSWTPQQYLDNIATLLEWKCLLNGVDSPGDHSWTEVAISVISSINPDFMDVMTLSYVYTMLLNPGEGKISIFRIINCIQRISTGLLKPYKTHPRSFVLRNRTDFAAFQVSSGETYCRNITFLLDTKNGDGIEAWVNLTDEDMAKFETDKELLTYASPTI
ncbi:hypothetical protein Ddye_025782 [Dipteronia dyeriana]|uniref:Uncharacterized protein n=1 Tax=Dipteronia dyeriana TaxID=168575 RepID=A0AAD9TKW5_9ROSI|nr:hypothetical protein Ddye_025782 [Dipteronia dyeriana]